MRRKRLTSEAKTVISHLLSCEENYGYGVARDTNLRMQTVYAILRSLEARGFVDTRKEIVGGRLRKYYALNLSGVEHWQEERKNET